MLVDEIRRNAGRLWRDLLFRSVVTGVLLIAAVIIATRPIDKPGYEDRGKQQSEQSTGPQVEDHSFLGVGAEGWTAIFTGGLAVLTLVLASAAFVQLRFLVRADETSRQAAQAARESAEVARATLISANRPWLKVSAKISDQPLQVSPTQISLHIDIEAENIGNAPALNVSPNVWMLVWRTDEGHNPHEEHSRRCERAAQFPSIPRYTLFPRDRFPDVAGVRAFGFQAVLNAEEIQAGLNAGGTNGSGNSVLSLFIGGCVSYTIPSDPDRQRITSFLFTLECLPPMGPVRPSVASIPQQFLHLRKDGFGSGNSAT